VRAGDDDGGGHAQRAERVGAGGEEGTRRGQGQVLLM
jgi:hypothetical protein